MERGSSLRENSWCHTCDVGLLVISEASKHLIEIDSIKSIEKIHVASVIVAVFSLRKRASVERKEKKVKSLLIIYNSYWIWVQLTFVAGELIPSTKQAIPVAFEKPLPWIVIYPPVLRVDH